MEEPDAAPPGRRRRRRSRGPGGTANVTRREYAGCALYAVGFLVLVAVSFTVGIALRPDQGPDEVSLLRAGTGDSAYELVGGVDEAGDPCVSLRRPGQDEAVTGQCGLVGEVEGEDAPRYRVTSTELPDGTTVVFGPVPRQAVSVRLRLSDGSRPTIAVRRSDRADLSWFSHETSETVDGPAEMLDGAGVPLDPP